ncbi:MAG: transporter substrate-binding domain-containing protein [Aminobacteriaceae bacterium]
MKLIMKAVLVAVFCLAATGAWALTVDDITYMTEDYPPMNMTGEDGVPTGLAVDVLAEIFTRMGSSKTAKDIQVLPWARSYNEVQNTPNTCLFSMTVTEERLPLFKWVGPVFVLSFDAVALKSKGIKVSSVEELANLKAGVIRDDQGDTLAKEAGIKEIERVPSNDQNIKKLNEGRIDVWIYSFGSARTLLEEMGFNPDDYESAWNLSKSDVSFAFHKDVDDELIAEMQKTLDEIKADGTYDEIMKKYGL